MSVTVATEEADTVVAGAVVTATGAVATAMLVATEAVVAATGAPSLPSLGQGREPGATST